MLFSRRSLKSYVRKEREPWREVRVKRRAVKGETTERETIKPRTVIAGAEGFGRLGVFNVFKIPTT